MQLNLVAHPHTPPSQPVKIWATAELVASFGAMATLNLWFGIEAPMARFALPQTSAPQRRGNLWETTCFEAFLREDGEDAYREWNFAPSGDWAAYDFTAHRDGMVDADVAAEPYIRVEDNLTWWTLGATIAVEAGKNWQAGLSAVIEEADGTRSYWALAHPQGDPDFHNPDCFIARLQ